jgi:hypothetical protein
MSRVSQVGGAGAQRGKNPGIDGKGDQSEPNDEDDSDRDEPTEPSAKRPKSKPVPNSALAHPTTDQLEPRRLTKPTKRGQVAATGLADIDVTAEDEKSGPEQLERLRQRLRALEGSFRYMGKAHPDYEATRQEIERLKMFAEETEK